MGTNGSVIAGLDIGTTNTRAVIARFTAENGIRILGSAIMPTEGVRKSTVTDAAEIVPIARATVEAAERDAHQEVDSVFMSIGGGHIHSCTVAAVLNILDGDETIQERHLDDLLDKARNNAAEKGREFLHTIPQEYRLDGHGGVQHPAGLQAARLEAGVHMITADRTFLENHGRVANDAGFKVLDICFSIIADGHCVLSEQEKKDGVLLVDIGGGSCAYAVYFNNTVYYSNVFAVGGDHITNDLALGLRLATPDAEDLKCTYSRLIRITEAAKDPNVIQLQTADHKTKSLARADVEMIIDSRIEELLQFVCDDIEQRQYRPLLARGAVFVGGTTRLYRFAERAEKTFSIPVRIGIPRILTPEDAHEPTDIYSDRHEHLRDTLYATVLGLVRYGCRQQMETQRRSRGFLRRLFSFS